MWSAESEAMLAEDRRRVLRALSGIAPRQREAIVLRYVADQTEKDTASVLGISEGAVSSALVAARRTLAAQLADRQETRS